MRQNAGGEIRIAVVADDDVAGRCAENGDGVAARPAEDHIVAAAHRNGVGAAITRIERLDRRQLAVRVEVDLAVVANDHVAGAAERNRVGADAADDDAVPRAAGRSARAGDRVVAAVGGIEALDRGENAIGVVDLAVGADDDVRADGADDDRVGAGPADHHVIVAERDVVVAAKGGVDRGDLGDRLRCAQAVERIDHAGGLARDVDDAIGAENGAGAAAGDGDRVGAGELDAPVHPGVHRQ